MPPKKADLRVLADIPDDALMLDVQQVAAVLAVSVNTVRRWREMGRLPHSVNLHGRVRWRKADIVAFVRSLTDCV